MTTVGSDLMRALNRDVTLTGLSALRGTNGVLHLAFSNGLVISVIRHEGSYGNKNGESLFEATHWIGEGDIAQPKGWLTQEQVVEYIRDTHAEYGPQVIAQWPDPSGAEFIQFDLLDSRKG